MLLVRALGAFVGAALVAVMALGAAAAETLEIPTMLPLTGAAAFLGKE